MVVLFDDDDGQDEPEDAGEFRALFERVERPTRYVSMDRGGYPSLAMREIYEMCDRLGVSPEDRDRILRECMGDE